MWGFYGFRGGFGGGGRRKKKQKQKKENWFERLNQSQIKELLSAARLPVSGTKKAQIERLFASPLTSEYGEEAGHNVFSRSDGKTVDDLKADCKAAGLVQGGVKYDLVIRLIKHKAGALAPPQITPAPPQAQPKSRVPSSVNVGAKRKVEGGSAAARKRPVASQAEASESASDASKDESEEDDEDDEDTYDVDRILSSRKKAGKTEYLVRWKGYDDEDDDTWEPEAHLHKDLISDFLEASRKGASSSTAQSAALLVD